MPRARWIGASERRTERAAEGQRLQSRGRSNWVEHGSSQSRKSVAVRNVYSLRVNCAT